jgi:hypothetical protein
METEPSLLAPSPAKPRGGVSQPPIRLEKASTTSLGR